MMNWKKNRRKVAAYYVYEIINEYLGRCLISHISKLDCYETKLRMKFVSLVRKRRGRAGYDSLKNRFTCSGIRRSKPGRMRVGWRNEMFYKSFSEVKYTSLGKGYNQT